MFVQALALPHRNIYLKLFCCLFLFIYHGFQPNTHVARFQDQFYSWRICYLRHHYALKRGSISVLLLHAAFNTAILCKLQLNIYNSFKSSKGEMVLKHNCDVGFAELFFISKYLQSLSVEKCIETTYRKRKYSINL